MFESLLEMEDLASKFFLQLKWLATDKTINVRICVAKLLATHLRNKSTFSFNKGGLSTTP